MCTKLSPENAFLLINMQLEYLVQEVSFLFTIFNNKFRFFASHALYFLKQSL